ncbi:MAG: DUF1538 domain-containing protein [Ruminococcaceae bacterium]|nr:DUF1538 domain-containing protein [Oscillospiraceae bacterium]
MRQLYGSINESLHSVLPICAIVLLLSISLSPVMPGVMVMFLFGAMMLILGMSIFTIGSTISMEPLGEGVGIQLGKSKKKVLPVIICFVVGMLITIAEPDLQVLAEKVPSINNWVLIILVALGVGVFLAVALIKARFKIRLSYILVPLYALVLILACLPYIPGLNIGSVDFIPTAFDSGGVTTGPITVPFIMALGAGLASMRKDKRSAEDSFGLVALCSIGPILSVLILSLVVKPEPVADATSPVDYNMNTREAFLRFLDPETGILRYIKEVAMAFLPIVGMFIVYQLIFKRFKKLQVIRICVGFAYTYIGLVLFMTGANVGFMPAGQLIGEVIAKTEFKYALIPIGMILGYFVVSAEPAVHTLKKQVEEVTNGAISQKSIGIALSVGVAVSIGIAMTRVLTGIPILPILIVGYIIPLVITFFVPPIYTGIAFDSGGVASGPMATTFILPFAIGACEALGGNVMTDAFGIVAMIAMTPLITIQVLGLIGKTRQDRMMKKIHMEFEQIDDGIVYYATPGSNQYGI